MTSLINVLLISLEIGKAVVNSALISPLSIKSLFKNSLGEFLAKTTKQIGEDPINFIQNQKNFDDMLTEFFVFFRNPNNVNSVTKNVNAYKMAKEFFDAKIKS